MIPIELVHPVAAHLRGTHAALPDEALQAAPDADFRPTRHLRRHIPCGQRLARECQDGEYRTVQGRRDGASRVGEVHDLKV